MAKQRKHIGKNILFGILLIGLCLPLIQQLTQFASVRALSGAIVNTKPPVYSSENWFNGTFQDTSLNYINDNFGFRNDFIRLNNQRLFMLYNEARANGVIIGKENYLYEIGYIRAAFGNDFVGFDTVKRDVEKLKRVNDTLNSLGKKIVFLFAPGKASYFPEYVPDKYAELKHKQTNLKAYTDELKRQRLDYVDLNTWFVQAKDTTQYPLYAKCGIHWSKYSEYLVMDTLVNYFENLMEVDLPELVFDGFHVSEENKNGDYDVGEGMNLYSKISTFPMAYVDYHFDKENPYDTVRSIVVADSYYWGLFGRNLSSDCFKEGEFWYYNNKIFSDVTPNGMDRDKVDLAQRIESNDVFIILSTDANLDDFGFNFIDQMYEFFYTKKGIR